VAQALKKVASFASSNYTSYEELEADVERGVEKEELNLDLSVEAVLTEDNIARFAEELAAGNVQAVEDELKAYTWANWTVTACSDDPSVQCAVCYPNDTKPYSGGGRRLSSTAFGTSVDFETAKAAGDYFVEMWEKGLTPGLQLMNSDHGRELLNVNECQGRIVFSSIDTVFWLLSCLGFRGLRFNASRIASKFNPFTLKVIEDAAATLVDFFKRGSAAFTEEPTKGARLVFNLVQKVSISWKSDRYC
jgi:hypothetical protein